MIFLRTDLFKTLARFRNLFKLKIQLMILFKFLRDDLFNVFFNFLHFFPDWYVGIRIVNTTLIRIELSLKI